MLLSRPLGADEEQWWMDILLPPGHQLTMSMTKSFDQRDFWSIWLFDARAHSAAGGDNGPLMYQSFANGIISYSPCATMFSHWHENFSRSIRDALEYWSQSSGRLDASEKDRLNEMFALLEVKSKGLTPTLAPGNTVQNAELSPLHIRAISYHLDEREFFESMTKYIIEGETPPRLRTTKGFPGEPHINNEGWPLVLSCTRGPTMVYRTPDPDPYSHVALETTSLIIDVFPLARNHDS